MIPSNIIINLFSPSYVQSPIPTVHVCYFPSNTFYSMQQGYFYWNLDENFLLKIQFQSYNVPQSQYSSIPPSEINKNRQISINRNMRVNERIYNYERKISREKQKQKFGRNIKSNIFGNMLLFVRKQKITKVLTRKIIQKHQLKIKMTQFYYMLNKKSKYRKAYFTKMDIAAFFEGEYDHQNENASQRKEIQFKIVFRMLCKMYLNKYHIPYIFSSYKIKKQSKRLHLKMIREFLRF